MWLERGIWYPTSGVMNPLGCWGEPEMRTRGKMNKETSALCCVAVWKSRVRKTQQWKTPFKILWDNTQRGFSTAQHRWNGLFRSSRPALVKTYLLFFTSEVNFPQDRLTVNRSSFYSYLFSWHNSQLMSGAQY